MPATPAPSNTSAAKLFSSMAIFLYTLYTLSPPSEQTWIGVWPCCCVFTVRHLCDIVVSTDGQHALRCHIEQHSVKCCQPKRPHGSLGGTPRAQHHAPRQVYKHPHSQILHRNPSAIVSSKRVKRNALSTAAGSCAHPNAPACFPHASCTTERGHTSMVEVLCDVLQTASPQEQRAVLEFQASRGETPLLKACRNGCGKASWCTQLTHPSQACAGVDVPAAGGRQPPRHQRHWQLLPPPQRGARPQRRVRAGPARLLRAGHPPRRRRLARPLRAGAPGRPPQPQGPHAAAPGRHHGQRRCRYVAAMHR